MKRFLKFCYYAYYPSGAHSDFEGDFNSLEEATAGSGELEDFMDVLDIQEGNWHRFRSVGEYGERQWVARY